MDIQLENLPDAANGAVHLSSQIPDTGLIAVALMGSGLILFVLFVLPIWLFLHYRSRSKQLSPPPVVSAVRADTYEDLADLARLAERFENRLDAVETLMDAEKPRWRK